MSSRYAPQYDRRRIRLIIFISSIKKEEFTTSLHRKKPNCVIIIHQNSASTINGKRTLKKSTLPKINQKNAGTWQSGPQYRCY